MRLNLHEMIAGLVKMGQIVKPAEGFICIDWVQGSATG